MGKKALDVVLQAESIPASAANNTAIAAECGGDLRHALNALQLACAGRRREVHVAAKASSKRGRGRGRASPLATQNGSTNTADIQVGTQDDASAELEADATMALRTASLGIFHALGKLLYCK